MIQRLYIIIIFALWLVPKGIAAQEGLEIDTVREDRISHRIMTGFPIGEFAGERQVGFSVRYAALYDLWPRHRIGLGVGIEQFLPEGNAYLPLTLEWQGQVLAKWGFFYTISAGYAFSMHGTPNDAPFEEREVSGGISGQLMAGYSFPVGDRFHFLSSLAFHYQQARTDWEHWGGRTEQDMTFRRFSLNIGFMF